jgi:hypothetical protein
MVPPFDPWLSATGDALLTRQDDQLTLGVSWRRMRRLDPGGVEPSTLEADEDACLVVALPPQHIGDAPVDWAPWTMPGSGSGFTPGGRFSLPRGHFKFSTVIGDDGTPVQFADESATTGMRLEGRVFRPGDPIASTFLAADPGGLVPQEGTFAIDSSGAMCLWRGTAWEHLGSPGGVSFRAGDDFAVGARGVDLTALFAVATDRLCAWTLQNGWFEPSPTALPAGASIAATGEVDGAVAAVGGGLVLAFLDLTSGAWDEVRSSPHPSGFADGSPVSSVLTDQGELTCVVASNGETWGHVWAKDQWHFIETNRADPLFRTALSRLDGGSGAPCLAFVDAQGILRAYDLVITDFGISAVEAIIGDWFVPGSFVSFDHPVLGERTVGAVSVDHRLRTARRSGGTWIGAPTHASWSPLGAFNASPLNARIAAPSLMAVRVPQGERVELTVSGILSALSRFPSGAATAGDVGTQFEIPWGLTLQPHDELTARHPHVPVTSTAGDTAAWQSALSREGADDVRLHAVGSRPDSEFSSTGSSTPALAEFARTRIRDMTARGFVVGMSGATMSADGVFDGGTWQHRMAAGRDLEVQTSLFGRLLPFGHRAVYTEHITRVIDPRGERATAPLRRVTVLVVTEPDVRFADDGSRARRAFPFDAVRISPVSIPLDRPADPAQPFLPSRAGQPVRFTVTLVQGDSQQSFSMPLVFTFASQPPLFDDDTVGGMRDAFGAASDLPDAAIAKANELGVQSTPGVVVALAGSTVTECRELTLGLVRDAAGALHPQLTAARISTPALRAFGSDVGETIVRFTDPYLDAGDARRALAIVFGDSPLQKIQVDLSRAADRAGAVATPSFAVDGLSAAGDLVNSAVLGAFDPEVYFDGLTAKLLGIVDLKEVIAAVPGIQAPRITTIALPSEPAPRVVYDWPAVPIGGFSPLSPIPDQTATLTLHVEMNPDPVGGVSALSSGTVTNFQLDFAEVLVVQVRSLSFQLEAGRTPVVKVDGLSVEFAGDLRFLESLTAAIAAFVGTPPVSIDATPQGITVSRSVALPEITIGAGVFAVSLRGAVFAARLRLPFDGALAADVSFGTRAHPFTVGVWILGGGGYLEMKTVAGRIVEFAAAVEIGGVWGFDWAVVKGEVHALVGIEFRFDNGGVQFTGYLRIGGSVEVLGIISVSIEARAELTARDEQVGSETLFRIRASVSLVIEVDLFLVSFEQEIEEDVVIYESSSGSEDETEGSRSRDAASDEAAWLRYAGAFLPAGPA